MSLNITTTTGQIVKPGRTALVAQTGQHAGRAFRIDKIAHDGIRYMVVASRKHNSRIRHAITVLPEVFGILISEVEEIAGEIARDVWSAVKWVWLKIDEGLYMGTAALVPLAYFEHYDLATKIVEFFNAI